MCCADVLRPGAARSIKREPPIYAEENPGKTFGHDRRATGGTKRDGGVFAAAAASKIAPGDDNWVRRFQLCVGDETLGVLVARQAAQREP